MLTQPEKSIEELINSASPSSTRSRRIQQNGLTYSTRASLDSLQGTQFPQEVLSPNIAYQLIHDQLQFDGNPQMNGATFLTTWMEKEARDLINENLAINFADQDEYPATLKLHGRCVRYLSHLWKIPADKEAVGTAVCGSSEGIMLGGLAMKWRWRERRQAEGKDTRRPNIVFGANSQVALEKFARYFDVEARTVPVSEESRYVLDPRKALEYIDENTIGMFIILGSTYTGHFESVEEMSRLLDDLQARTGIDVPIHVDGASGAFVAPFAFPEHRWAFDVSRVVSINASGHKYGLAYPGIGWVLWKSREYLPKDLIFELHYLGGTEETYTLNFSRPACFVIAQYYTFIRYGYKGYAQVMNTCLHNARLLSVALEATDIFCVLSDIHRPHGIKGHSTANIKAARELFIAESNKDYELHDPNQNLPYNVGVPVVSFRVSDEYLRDHPELDQDALSTMFRVRGWIVPNYELPRDCNNTYIFRIVVKETTTEDMVDNFLQDILWAVSTLEKISMKEHNVLSHIPQPSYHTIPKLARHLTNLGAREKKEEEAEEEGAKPAQRTKPAASGTLYDRIVGTYLRHKGSLDEVKRKSKGSGKDLFSHTC